MHSASVVAVTFYPQSKSTQFGEFETEVSDIQTV